MLHTESAFGVIHDEPQFYQLDLARSLLQRSLGSLGRSEPGAKDFAARWHALTAMLHCVRNDEPRARFAIERGRALDVNHKYVNLVDNALFEYRIVRSYKGNLQLVAQRYRLIVSDYPDFFEARLRLGRILTLNAALQSAREQLEIVAARATSTDVVYLAHMFLASVHERARRDADAEREYEAARAVAPYPSALIALIRIAAMRGQTEHVRMLAEEIPAMEAAGEEDPWSHYNLCVTAGDLFEGLRADARRP
jgi:tetratricopeptide (TPR) repeat protein